ncbi:MAG TPA: hypothetical protein VD886_24250 [Herpetosiphonaceae bacterium]|nr:hypothetical protein [Herpetosiphonaceae bacterium]
MTVKMAVVRTFRRTKPRRWVARCLFVCLGIRDNLIGIRQRHRARFGIESSYRQVEALRIRTTLSSPALRLMVAGIALVLLKRCAGTAGSSIHAKRVVCPGQLLWPELYVHSSPSGADSRQPV